VRRARSSFFHISAAGQVDEVHALRHHQQVLGRGQRRAQVVQLLLDVGDRAEVDLALHPHQLELRALAERRRDLGADDERPAGASVSKPITLSEGFEVRYR
jgi:hypothetical protein